MNPTPQQVGLSYREAGVDIEAADRFVDRIKEHAKSTWSHAVLPGTAAYAGLLQPDLSEHAQPVLAATCDGVGTKLLVAIACNQYEGLGQDLVAMNVNDLLPSGSRPLMFLDYIATGKLEAKALEAVVRGVANACRAVGCALLGGETAEMPGLYKAGEFDLAGFAVGMVDAQRIPDPSTIRKGDLIFALPSSGLHANGYSLARRALLERGALSLEDTPQALGRPLGTALLEPTRLYVNEVLRLMAKAKIKAGAHITGGGLLGRMAKLMPAPWGARLFPQSYPRPPIIDLVQRCGDVSDEEMASTFNMGLGYVVVVDPSDASEVAATRDDWLQVGEITSTQGVDLGYARR